MDITGGLANAGLSWLFEQFGEWLSGWINKGLSGFVEFILEGISSITGEFWNISAIEMFLDFSAWVNLVVLVISLLFLCMDIAEQNGRVNWKIVVSNLFKGFFFMFFNRYLGLMTYELSESCLQALDISMEPVSDLLPTFNTALSTLFITVVIIIAFISFLCMSMLRNGTLFVQILSSSFYIPDIIRGDTAKMDEWMRMTIAISATYFVQYILFYLGLNLVGDAGWSEMLTMLTCWLTMFFVPKILNRFGYASGASAVFSAAGSVAGAGMGFVK